MSDLRQLYDVFEKATTLPPGERDSFISDVAERDPKLAQALGNLLLDDSLDHSPLDASLDDLVASLVDDPGEASAVPDRLGPYRILGELGRGGMGTVYLGQRDDGHFDQQVAIKVLRRGVDTDDVVARFKAERQILAQLDHPHVGRLLDGGVAPDGRPYFAMEYVDGQPITDYADACSLTLDERVELFDAAAAAVRFAHTNLVIHRDIKPSNVMVTNDGTVKLLDFGIAKVLDPTTPSDQTRTQHRALTPAYAAPEQESGGPITTATDVFSLGVLLHELLTGIRPVWKGQDAVRPSTASTLVPAAQTTTDQAGTPGVSASESSAGAPVHASEVATRSRLRRTTPQKLGGALRGDLDAILLKALEHDPNRRYASVDGLVDDLNRYREGLPVTARRATPGYRLLRFARRNRGFVASAAAVLVALLVGLGATLQQRNVARAERDAADAVTRYLEGMFASVNPVGGETGADTLRVVDFLDRSTERAVNDLSDSPEIRARLLGTLARAHLSLGNASRASELWEEGLADQQLAGSNPSPAFLVGLAEAGFALGRWQAADSLLHRATLLAPRNGADSLRLRILVTRINGFMRQNRYEDTPALFEEAEPLARRLGDPQQLAHVLTSGANLAMARGDLQAAIERQQEAISLWREVRGPDDMQVSISFTNLSILLRSAGDVEGAEAAAVEAIRISEIRVPPGHEVRIRPLNTYANLLTNRGELERADSIFTVAAEQATSPAAKQSLLQVLGNHAGNRRQANDTAGALELSRRAVEVASEVYAGTPVMMEPLRQHAFILDFAGDTAQADLIYEQAATAAGDAVPPQHPGRIIVERGAARGLSRRGRHQEAETRMRELLERTPYGAPEGSLVQRTRDATLRELAAVYRRWGRVEDAARIEAQRLDAAPG